MKLSLSLIAHFLSVSIQSNSLEPKDTEKSPSGKTGLNADKPLHIQIELSHPHSSNQFNDFMLFEGSINDYSPEKYSRQNDPILKLIGGGEEGLLKSQTGENRVILSFGLVASWYRTNLNFRATLKLLELVPDFVRIITNESFSWSDEKNIGRHLSDTFENLNGDEKSTLARMIIGDVFQVNSELFDRVYEAKEWAKFAHYWIFLSKIYNVITDNTDDFDDKVEESRRELRILDYHPKHFSPQNSDDPVVNYFDNFEWRRVLYTTPTLTEEELKWASPILARGMVGKAWRNGIGRLNHITILLEWDKNWIEKVVERFVKPKERFPWRLALRKASVHSIMNSLFKDLDGNQKRDLAKAFIDDPSYEYVNDYIIKGILDSRDWNTCVSYDEFVEYCKSAYEHFTRLYELSLGLVQISRTPAQGLHKSDFAQ